MEAASSDDPVGYAAPWHPVGSLPGWVYAPDVPAELWASPAWASLPVASVRLGVTRTRRRTSFVVRHAVPSWVALGWIEALGGTRVPTPPLPLPPMYRVASAESVLRVVDAVLGPNAPAVLALLDADPA